MADPLRADSILIIGLMITRFAKIVCRLKTIQTRPLVYKLKFTSNMGQARPEQQIGKDTSLLKDYLARKGDPLLLERLKMHPALEVIRRLHQDELDKAQAVAVLTELNDKLGECKGLALTAKRLKSVGIKAGPWMNLLGQVQSGIMIDRANRDSLQRKGIIIDLPEIYFVAACLIPYMASLKRKTGKRSLPKWKWIEQWITKEAQLGTKNLRQLWNKEVIHRKTWPSRTLLYALASGMAVPLEQDKGGRRVDWTLEWRLRPGRVRGRTEEHPIKLKRGLSEDDRSYLELALQYTPLARWDLERLYPEIAGRIPKMPDTLQKLLASEKTRRVEALPSRLRLQVKEFNGEKVDRRVEFKKELAKLIEAIPLEERACLKKLTRQSWRKILAKRS